MKVFISWSGDISLRFAQNFASWLESVIQAVKPFVSKNDIRTGSRWFSEIGKQLEETNFGILCVTPDNKEAPWLLFEAGALSKKIEQSHVCPLLLGVKNSDLRPPLSMFHATDATDPDNILKLLSDINSTLDKNALSSDVLKKVFDKNRSDLEVMVNNTLTEINESQKKHGAPAKRSSEDMLEEILGITRGMAQNLPPIRTKTIKFNANPSQLDTLNISGLADASELFKRNIDERQLILEEMAKLGKLSTASEILLSAAAAKPSGEKK